MEEINCLIKTITDMEATVKFPASENMANLRPSKNDPSKKATYVTVEANGKRYNVYAVEGTDIFNAVAGAKVQIEVKDEPAEGRNGYAFIAGQKKPFGQYAPREFKRPTPEKLKEMCDTQADIFKAMRGRLPDVETDVIATLSASIYSKI